MILTESRSDRNSSIRHIVHAATKIFEKSDACKFGNLANRELWLWKDLFCQVKEAGFSHLRVVSEKIKARGR